MTEAASMFAPLPKDELSSNEPAEVRQGPSKTPIVPVPDDAPEMSYRHPAYGVPSERHAYYQPNGALVGYAARFDFIGKDGEPDKEVLPITFCDLGDGRRGWRSKAFPEPRPLYNLPQLVKRPEDPVLIVEGEKCADAAAKALPAMVVVTWPGGGKAAHKADWPPLRGRRVTIWGDTDSQRYPDTHPHAGEIMPAEEQPGHKTAVEIATILMEIGAAEVRIVPTPRPGTVKDGWDIADAIAEGWSADRLRAFVATATPITGHTSAPSKPKLSDSPFRLDPDGVRKRVEADDGSVSWKWFCSHLEVAAETRNENGQDWGRLLIVTTPEGQRHEWAMPMEILAGDGAPLRAELLRLGFVLAPGAFARNALQEYISTARVGRRARCVSRTGWHGKVYVRPDGAYGESEGERVLLQTMPGSDHAYRQAGSLADWQEEVGKLCVGNSRLALGVSVAFAAPLVYLTGEESGGINFQGRSRSGKSTALRVAGSVCGGGGVNGYPKSWRATSNGLEGIAVGHCDALLCLDEMGQVDAREAGEIAYMLSNGSGKNRAQRDGSGRPAAQWRLLFLSTGELSLADKMAEGGKRPKAGQQVRLVDVPADAGADLGLFETLHGFPSADAFARHLRDATTRFYGTPIDAFLRKITADLDGLAEAVSTARQDFVKAHVPEGASGQVLSVAGRFGLVAAAGTLAMSMGVLPWPEGEAERAAAKCFAAWLERRGGTGASEAEAGLAQVRRFFEMHGESRFTPWGGDDSHRPTINRAGFRRFDDDGGVEFFAFPEAFKSEICAGCDPRSLARELIARGLLLPASDGKPAAPHRLPGMTKPCRVYHFAAGILGGDDA